MNDIDIKELNIQLITCQVEKETLENTYEKEKATKQSGDSIEFKK